MKAHQQPVECTAIQSVHIKTHGKAENNMEDFIDMKSIAVTFIPYNVVSPSKVISVIVYKPIISWTYCVPDWRIS